MSLWKGYDVRSLHRQGYSTCKLNILGEVITNIHSTLEPTNDECSNGQIKHINSPSFEFFSHFVGALSSEKQYILYTWWLYAT